ncbi:MAG: UDP-N-acetylmuramate--L-alanine ligase [Planctomycetes bacterium]|nr:UDP-N-acetylmuramate--L-alanine ligase [Planctomycetota bacterium]
MNETNIPELRAASSGANATRARLPSRVHFVGAGGAGLSGAALLLLERGHQLSGHDRAVSGFVDALRARGMPVAVGQSDARLLGHDVQLVVRSAAIGLDDPQVAEALRRGLPVLKYAELLGLLGPERRTLAVAGTHGKTTSSWLVFHALRGIAHAAGADAPGALVGGSCRVIGSNAVPGGARGWFACEACEYDRSFLQLAPEGAIVTNVEADHLDYYGSLAAIEEAFARFVDRVHPEGLLVVGREVPARVEHAARCAVWRLGRELHVDLLGESQGRFRFRLRGPGWATPPVALAIPGAFNVDNAALALALAVGLAGRTSGLSPAECADGAARGVQRYVGAARRFEPWGTFGGIELVHDYAHHPTEVRVTLEAARRAFAGKPLHVLFQPHQHSRTARFLDEFVDALRGADRVLVADVYGARQHIDREAAGAPELVARLRRAGLDALEAGSPSAAVKLLAAGLPSPCAALILGAGDIDLAHDELIEAVALRGSAARLARA